MKLSYPFKVCRYVHHRIIQIDHQPDAIILQFIILTFIYSSTCFGRRLCCVVVCDLETSRMGAPYIYMTLVA